MTWYATNPIKKGFKAVFSGESYGKDVKRTRERMRAIQTMVREEVNLSNDLRLGRVERNRKYLIST